MQWFCVKTGGSLLISVSSVFTVTHEDEGELCGAREAHHKFIEAMILLQRLSVKLAYLLIKQFYLVNSFGLSAVSAVVASGWSFK